jgi:hypothetical protein
MVDTIIITERLDPNERMSNSGSLWSYLICLGMKMN